MCPDPLPQTGRSRTQGAERGGSLGGATGVPFLAGKGLSWWPRVSCKLQLRGRQEPQQPEQEHTGPAQVTRAWLRERGRPPAPWGWGSSAPCWGRSAGRPWEGQPGTPGGDWGQRVPCPGGQRGGLAPGLRCGLSGAGMATQGRDTARGCGCGTAQAVPRGRTVGQRGAGFGAGPWGRGRGGTPGPRALSCRRGAPRAGPGPRSAAGCPRPPPAGSSRGCRRRGKAEPGPGRALEGTGERGQPGGRGGEAPGSSAGARGRRGAEGPRCRWRARGGDPPGGGGRCGCRGRGRSSRL